VTDAVPASVTSLPVAVAVAVAVTLAAP